MATLDEIKKENLRSIETHLKVYKSQLERLDKKIQQFNPNDKADKEDFYHENFTFEINQITEALSYTAKSLSEIKSIRPVLNDISD